MPIRVRRTPNAERQLADIADPAPEAPVPELSLAPPTATTDQGAAQQPAPPFLSLTEAADWLCVSVSTLKRLIAKGDLTTIRVGARQKIPASHLEAYVAKDILLPSQVTDPVQSDEV
jgi:excisionase family DNA binding protein